MISLDSSGSASAPSARQTEIIGTLAPDMDIAKVVVKILGSLKLLLTRSPLTSEIRVFLRRDSGGRWGDGRRRRRALGDRQLG